jgi:DNA-directed RNA polymerase
MSAIETLTRHADILRAQLEHDAEQAHRAAAELAAASTRFATVDAESTMVLAVAYHHASVALAMLLHTVMHRSGELTATARAIELTEVSNDPA